MGLIKKLLSTIGLLKEAEVSGDAWKDPAFTVGQGELADRQLQEMREGKPPLEYSVAADALKQIPGTEPLSLIDVGCGNGYYSEAIKTLVGDRFSYTGADYSDSMLEASRKRYPGVEFIQADIRRLGLPDKSYDVVLSGAVLIHVREWEQGLRELARITGKYLVMHRFTVTDKPTYTSKHPNYGGNMIMFNTINEGQFMSIMKECGMKLIRQLPFPESGTDKKQATFIFERADS